MRPSLGQQARMIWKTHRFGSDVVGTGFVRAFDQLGTRPYSIAGDRLIVCPGFRRGLGSGGCGSDGNGLIYRQDLAGFVTSWDVTSVPGIPFTAALAAMIGASGCSARTSLGLVANDRTARRPGGSSSTGSTRAEGPTGRCRLSSAPGSHRRRSRRWRRMTRWPRSPCMPTTRMCPPGSSCRRMVAKRPTTRAPSRGSWPRPSRTGWRATRSTPSPGRESRPSVMDQSAVG